MSKLKGVPTWYSMRTANGVCIHHGRTIVYIDASLEDTVENTLKVAHTMVVPLIMSQIPDWVRAYKTSLHVGNQPMCGCNN